MRRICPKCGSSSVVTFDADEDWCTQCKSRFPGVSDGGCASCETLRAEVTRLTHDLANEREKVERLRISQQEEIDRYINECNHADTLEREHKAELERLTAEIRSHNIGNQDAQAVISRQAGMLANLRAEVERLREGLPNYTRRIEELDRNLTAHHSALLVAEAERDKYKAVLERAQQFWTAQSPLSSHWMADRSDHFAKRVLEPLIKIIAGAVQQEETCDSCHGDLGDDAPVYEDADICRSCYNELQAAEAVRPLSGTLFLCPNCGAPHFNAIAGGFLVCANVTAHTDFRVKPGGCGWSGQLAEAVRS